MPTLEGKLDPFIDVVFRLAFQPLTFFVIEIIAGPVLLPSSIGQQQVEGYPGRENSPKAVFRTASKESERKKYLSKALAQIESSDRDDVPGPGSYEIAEQYNAIGKQILSQKRNAPSLSFQMSAPTGRDPIYSGDHRKDTLISPHKFGKSS